MMRPARLILLLAGLLVTGVAPAASPVQPSNSRQAMTSADNSWCIGRFRFTLPGGWRPTGRQQSIFRVDLRFSAEDTPNALWQSRLAQIQRKSAATGNPALRQMQLPGGFPAVWYRSSDVFDYIISLDAIRPLSEGALLASRESASGKEAAAEQLVLNVLRAWAPEQNRGFCLEKGAILTEPGQNEEVRISFSHPALPGAALRLYTHTVREPDKGDRSAELRALATRSEKSGEQLAIRRDGPRVVASLAGQEMWIGQSGGKKPEEVRFLWRFPGTSLRADQPAINLEAHGTPSQGQALAEAWESLLGSLSRVPLPTHPVR